METVDEETLTAAMGFMDRAVKQDKPFFLWWNATRMHIWTHLKPESKGVTGNGIFADGMVEHDGHVGRMLDKLDELGIADNTIVMYSTDNGAEVFSWPDGGCTSLSARPLPAWGSPATGTGSGRKARPMGRLQRPVLRSGAYAGMRAWPSAGVAQGAP